MSKKSVEKKSKKSKSLATKSDIEIKKHKRKKRIIIAIIVILIFALAGGGVAAYFLIFNRPKEDSSNNQPSEQPAEEPKFYSRLTGLEIKDESENSMPTYCIQIPNGEDGARPQTGLDEAGVVFEAIAEAGITRFAAVFQNPKSKAIGPIRSLRSYYLDWDTPFDCTIVHAGGSDDAVAAVAAGGYRDLTESLVYMWRDNTSYWAPNNLLTSPSLLAKAAEDDGYSTSNPVVFPRLTEDEINEILSGNNPDTEAEAEAEKEYANTTNVVANVQINFGSVPTYNTVYNYDADTNTYPRSYASGEEHLVYSCDDTDKSQPTPKRDCGHAVQIAPSAIAVMMVDERLDSDGYHHVIQTIGTGVAYVFQNGTATKGSWKKSSKTDQIEFLDSDGNTISFTAGQLWIAAVPNYGGSVKY